MIRFDPSTPLEDSGILLTGSTGTVGREVLASLLHRGREVQLLLRRPTDPRLRGLEAFLAEDGLDLPGLMDAGRVRVIEGDLADGPLPAPVGPPPRLVIHAAASVRFEPTPDGDPHRTNVHGTRRLLAWMSRHRVPRLIMVSTAYVGRGIDRPAGEHPVPASVPPRNAYEASKRTAEAMADEWSRRPGRRVTIVRPSIVVGRHDDGRVARCTGVYLAFRAVELLAARHADSPVRHRLPLRLDGRADAPLDLVPADWVASMIAGIADAEHLQGGILNLVHPDPPTNALVQRAIERAFDVAGGRFVGEVPLEESSLTPEELAFRRTIGPIRPYLVDGPRFDATAAIEASRQLGCPCPPWDEAAIGRLIAHAVASRWGRRAVPTPPAAAPHACVAYFRRHLPTQVAASEIARRAGITATVRFVLEDLPEDEGTWTCRFERGRLLWTRCGRSAPVPDFGYRLDSQGFTDVVGGRVDPMQVFLDGRAEIEGDVERAMMMGVVLEEFNRTHPWHPGAAG
jgi:nucleoside-diphosphate-sugar epimerase